MSFQTMTNDSRILIFDERPKTRDLQTAIALHQVAAVNFAHVVKKIRNNLPPPQLRNVYLGDATIRSAPPHLDLHFIFIHFNDMARVGFRCHPSFHFDVNSAIYMHGMSKLYSFNKNLDQSRLNLSLGVFQWGSSLIGQLDSKFEASRDLWFKYILAWIETLIPNHSFIWRITFLEEWQESEYDLTWFSNKFRAPMEAALRRLAANKPPITGDPVEFLEKCGRGDIGQDEFASIGPAMAMHYLIAREAEAKREQEKQEENERTAAKAAYDESQTRLQQLRHQDCDLEESVIEFSDEDDDEDEMDLDDESIPPPEGVDLTRVPWDAPWMQALLAIDTSIVAPTHRPESTRIPWIGEQEGHDMLTVKRPVSGIKVKEEVKEEVMEEEEQMIHDATGIQDLFGLLSL